MITLQEVLKFATKTLSDHSIPNTIFQTKQRKELATMPIRLGEERKHAAMFKNENWYNCSLEAKMLVSYTLKLTHEQLLLKSSNSGEDRLFVSEHDFDAIKTMLKRRLNKEPMAYILSQKEFYGINFIVTKDVLIPRPDSEVIIDAALDHFNQDDTINILELGVGSGCLILTLLQHLHNASGIGIDISSAAIKIAKQNQQSLNINNRVKFIERDWKKANFIKSLKILNTPNTENPKFNLIISNPPYINNDIICTLDDDVKNHEPHLALAGGKDGLDCYREILPIIKNTLSPQGIALIEIGSGQERSVQKLITQNKLRLSHSLKDLSGIIRTLVISE